MMMPCTLPIKQMCLKAVCPFLISLSLMRNTHKCKACKLARKSDTNFAVWKDKLISNGMTGLQEWDNVVNDYADSGKRKPKNPNFFGTLVSYMEEHGVFKTLPSTTNPLGLCHFYPTDRTIISMLTPPKLPGKADHVKSRVCFLSRRHSLGHISLLCSKVVSLLRWDYCRSCICGVHLLVFLSFGLMRPRTGTSLAYPVARFVRIPSRMIQHT